MSLIPSLQILSAAVHYGEPTDVVTLAVTATQCMREVAVGKEVKEYRAPGKEQKNLTEKVLHGYVHIHINYMCMPTYMM